MHRITIICVGKFKEKWQREAAAEYLKRLSRFSKIEEVELEEKDNEDKLLRISEGKGMRILLDIDGDLATSEKISETIESNGKLCFIIGGSNGVSKEFKSKMDARISFGRITLPHNMARIVLLEQVYRAFTIIEGSGYHK